MNIIEQFPSLASVMAEWQQKQGLYFIASSSLIFFHRAFEHPPLAKEDFLVKWEELVVVLDSASFLQWKCFVTIRNHFPTHQPFIYLSKISELEFKCLSSFISISLNSSFFLVVSTMSFVFEADCLVTGQRL